MRRAASCAAAVLIAWMPATSWAQEPPAEGSPWRGEVGGGIGLRSLFDLQILGGVAELRGGAQIREWVGVYGEAEYFRGATSAGLSVQTWQLGTRVDFRVWQGLHAGFGWGGTYFSIARARAGAITTAGVNADFFLRYHFVERGPFAAFVEVRADVSALDPLHTVDEATFVGPTLTCGVRF